MRANTHIVDVTGNIGKAQVQRDPVRRPLARHAGRHCHNPRVISFKNCFHMRRRDIELRPFCDTRSIKGKVLMNCFPRSPVQRPAGKHLSPVRIACDCHNLRAHFQQSGEKFFPAGVILLHGGNHQFQGLVHPLQVILHRSCHLRNRLCAIGYSRLHHGAAVCCQEYKNANAEDNRHHPHNHPHQDGCDPGCFPSAAGRVHRVPSACAECWRRNAFGDTPLYFLKQ